jgi:hypothetical protein
VRFRNRWKGTYEKVGERLEREQEATKREERPILFELVCKGLYPVIVVMKDPADKCSECRGEWWDFSPAFQHANGLPHFRQWCLEHPGLVRERFPEVIELVTEETLTEVRV